MRRKGAVLVLLFAAAVVVSTRALTPAPPAPRPHSPPTTAEHNLRDRTASPTRTSTPEAPQNKGLPALDAVATSCGLEARPYCEGGDCVALAHMPDLDHVAGWFSMAFLNPRFVWSVARRDLGIPEEVLSCGVALERLDRVGSVALPDGSEIWCTFDGSPAQAALCDQAARRRYSTQGGEFQRSDLRYLSFSQ